MNFESSFIQKLFLTIIAAFAFACLIQFYKVFIEGADRAMNSGYENRTGSGMAR